MGCSTSPMSLPARSPQQHLQPSMYMAQTGGLPTLLFGGFQQHALSPAAAKLAAEHSLAKRFTLRDYFYGTH
uniref:Uncharacterized protein n=1 Tax=Plectus sambesii TaxID=2011161 RepID=A0A914W1E7_9BILA